MYFQSSSVVNSICKVRLFSSMSFCIICNKSFCNKSSLLPHNREIHEKSESFRCDICEKVLNRKDNYDRHVRVCKAEFVLRLHVQVFISSHRTSTLSTEINYLNAKTSALNIFMRTKCQRHQQTRKVCYYKVLISASVPENQTECSLPTFLRLCKLYSPSYLQKMYTYKFVNIVYFSYFFELTFLT